MNIKKIDAFRINIQILMILLLFQFHVEKMLLAYIAIMFILSLTYYSNYFFKNTEGKWIFISLFVVIIFPTMIKHTIYADVNIVDIKILFNRFIFIFTIYIGYIFGDSIKNIPEQIDKVMNFIIMLFFINATVNVYTWYIETGGVISRYNFISPITLNPSAGISFSSLGFFLSLENLKDKKKRYIIVPIIFLTNIFIIVTRKEQLLFILTLVLYIVIKVKLIKKLDKKIFKIMFISIFTIICIGLFKTFGDTYSKYYSNLFSKDGADMMARKYARYEAINMFRENPIFGVGFGNYALNTRGMTVLQSAHNGMFSILSELGITGFLIFSLICIFLLKSVINLFRKKRLYDKYNIVFVIVITLNILTTFISNSVFLPPPSEKVYYLYAIIMWMIIGIIYKSKTNKIGE